MKAFGFLFLVVVVGVQGMLPFYDPWQTEGRGLLESNGSIKKVSAFGRGRQAERVMAGIRDGATFRGKGSKSGQSKSPSSKSTKSPSAKKSVKKLTKMSQKSTKSVKSMEFEYDDENGIGGPPQPMYKTVEYALVRNSIGTQLPSDQFPKQGATVGIHGAINPISMVNGTATPNAAIELGKFHAVCVIVRVTSVQEKFQCNYELDIMEQGAGSGHVDIGKLIVTGTVDSDLTDFNVAATSGDFFPFHGGVATVQSDPTGDPNLFFYIHLR